MGVGVGVRVSVSSIEDSGVSISRPLGVKSLGDGVKTSAGSKGDTIHVGVGSIGVGVSSIGGMSSIGQTSIAISSIEDTGVSLGISRPLAVVSVVGGISLGGSIKTLGDGVKSRAGSEWNISIGVGIAKATIVSIGVSLSGSKSSNTSQNNKFHHDCPDCN